MSLSRTLESLEEYIDAQREIVARARTDIETLRALKREARDDPQSFVENLEDKLANACLMQLDEAPWGPRYIDWRLLKGADPDIFRTVHIPSLRHRLSSSSQIPSPSSASRELGSIAAEFRPLVQEMVESSSEDEERPSTPAVAAPVDVQTRRRPLNNKRKREIRSDDDDDDDDDFVIGKPSTSTSTRKSKALPKAPAQPEVKVEPVPLATPPPKTSKARKPKERPAQFKVPWTLQEQHLLEKCLLEVPDTEKFRWVKISEAMGGIRTPRQVASRVQKYNEKLKKFGLS